MAVGLVHFRTTQARYLCSGPIAVKALGLAISPVLIARADPIAVAVGSTALEMPLEADRTEPMLLWSAILRGERDG